jgi:hypothetical protein
MKLVAQNQCNFCSEVLTVAKLMSVCWIYCYNYYLAPEPFLIYACQRKIAINNLTQYVPTIPQNLNSKIDL